MNDSAGAEQARLLRHTDLDALIARLVQLGYRVVGPRIGDGAIRYDDIGSAADLPSGWVDRQEGGSYRLHQDGAGRSFDFAAPSNSAKSFFLPAVATLWRAKREGKGWRILHPEAAKPKPIAFLGLRACDLAAIAVQDRTLLGGPYIDTVYRDLREGALFIVANCAKPASTCFCVSMGSGPSATQGFDLALSELSGGGRHDFLVQVGSEAGRALLAALPTQAAGQSDLDEARVQTEHATQHMGRSLERDGLPELLSRNLEHGSWREVANRCLSCANCTQVCPTCFCTTASDTTDLSGTELARNRRWDSCFSIEYSHIHGGSIRRSAQARYRQWMTHKLSTWVAQFGSSGCVGCGRCITWCPVGIDLTAQARTIREHDGGS